MLDPGQLSEYLDEVELNLFHQVTARFHQFVAVIVGVSKMEQEIERSLTNIKSLRNYSRMNKTRMSQIALSIVNMKKRSENMQKVSKIVKFYWSYLIKT